MFNFLDLVLEQLVIELRYENGYLYWDNSGKIWQKTLYSWPSAKADMVNVKEAKIVIPEKDISLTFSPDKIVLAQNYPSTVSDIGEFGEFAVSTIVEFLEISVFTRVGNRFIYMLKLDDEKESIDLLKKTGFFDVPGDKLSGIGDKVKSANVRFHITRKDEIGYGINLGYASRTLNIQLPKPIKYDSSKFVLSGLLIDIDFYTLKPIETGNVKCLELMKKNVKDMEHIVNGLFR